MKPFADIEDSVRRRGRDSHVRQGALPVHTEPRNNGFIGRASAIVMFVTGAFAALAIAACSGGGGTAAAVVNPVPHPSPIPSPTPTPVNCAIAKKSGFGSPSLVLQRALSNRIAATTLRNGPGPAVRVCPSDGPGLARCLAWKRTDGVRPNVIPGYSPASLQAAYSLTAASSANGAGQIVAIVDAYDDPNAEADMNFYRTTFALPACTTANGCFLKINQLGATSPLPGTDVTGGWEAEESLDLDMVSAICPNCSILLIEGNNNNTSNLFAAEDAATTTCTTNVVSNSWNASEYPSEASDETHFNHPGIVITVSAGDTGYPNSGYPTTSQYVTAVGGTHLTKVGSVWTESVWTGSGSMCSAYITQPAWQTALGSGYTSVCSKRIANDVSAVADPNTGVAVYDTFGGTGGCSAWCQFGGTSASAPIIGAVYALAGNAGTVTFGSFAYSHTASLNDVTSGSNGSCGATFLCTAGAGYDGPTGLGTPNGLGAF